MRKARFMATLCSATVWSAAVWSAAVWSAALMLLAVACGTGRSVNSSTERFACMSSLDCVTGFSCFCGYCQPVGGTTQCLADVTAGDTDVGSAPCNAATWAGCKANEGCYWDDRQKRQKKSVCLSYGTGALNSTCDASQLNACGKDPAAGPLLCDGLDKKCYPLCDTSRATPCAAGEACLPLQDADKRAWPNHAGICIK